MRDQLGLDYRFIYILGYFCNFGYRVFKRVFIRVGSGFFNKTWTRFRFFFLKKNLYPTLFLIELGKTRPIRVGSERVFAGQAKIAIPINKRYSNTKGIVYKIYGFCTFSFVFIQCECCVWLENSVLVRWANSAWILVKPSLGLMHKKPTSHVTIETQIEFYLLNFKIIWILFSKI